MNQSGTVIVGKKDGGRNVKQRQFSVIYLNAKESRQTTDITFIISLSVPFLSQSTCINPYH